jgi:excisionase family DNA binding protein
MARTAQLPPLKRNERLAAARASRERADGRPLMTMPETGVYLGVCTRTVYDLVKRGDLRSTKVAGRLRIRPGDADDYIDRHMAS